MSLLLALQGGGATNYTVTANAGSYAVTGVSASILRSRVLAGAAGSYTYAGVAAILKRSRLVTGAAGAYSYTGVAATIVKTTLNAYSITANAGAYSYSGQAATVTYSGGTPQQNYSAEVELKPWYVKRGKKIHLFNSAQEADDYIESLEQAEKAIQEAQKTSRRARQRLRRKIVTVEPIQTVDIDLLSDAVSRFDLPTLPNLIEQQDFARFMQILAIAQEMAEEEDIELLLLA